MKRFVNVLAVFTLLGISIFTGYTYAQSVDTNPVQITREGEIVGTYTGLSQAINEAGSGDVINLIEDISVTEASVISGKSLTINGDNHIITRESDITTITVNEGSSLVLKDIVITDNAVNFAPNRYDSLINAKSNIPFCAGGVNETRNESGEVVSSVCDTMNVDTAKTHPQIYSVGDIYGDNLTISNSLNSKGSAAIIVEKGGIEMINSSFIHNGASGTSNAGRGGAIRVGPNTATNIVDESPITKILFSGCLFEGNYGRTYGGALAIHYAPEVVTIENCIFSGNTAYSNGGAIHIPNIWNPKNPTGYIPQIPSGSNMPVGTLYVNNTNFYNNWGGNDGSAIENDDMHLEINGCYFEHNYGTQPLNTSVGVISCQAGGYYNRIDRGLIWREYHINNSTFNDTNTTVLGDHSRFGSYFVNNCIFENQDEVILSYNGRGEIKNSIIKNSNPFNNCGITGGIIRDVSIVPYSDYLDGMAVFGESTFKLENNTYSNDCTTNEYFQVRSWSDSTGINHIIIKGEDGTRLFVHRSSYDSDSTDIQGIDEIYYGVTIDDGKFAYIKKNKFYNFDEFNDELNNFSYSNSGYRLESGKTMLFYLDSGYTELWSGSISTNTNLYGKETDIYNIIYEGMEGVDFEGITHTYKFNNLNHAQYLTELTPYELNTPPRNGYVFEGWYLDEEYVEPIISIEEGSIGDVRVYAKWTKKPGGYSGGGGRRVESGYSEESQSNPKDSQKESENESEKAKVESNEFGEGENYSQEFNDAYTFAYKNGITTMDSIEKADMEGSLTRIAMAKMLSKYAINILGMKPDETRNNKFRDVTGELDTDYDNGVKLAYQLGIMGINMKDNKFRPYDLVSRGEFVTALSRMVYHTSDGEYESTTRYYTNHIATLEEKGIISNVIPDMQELRGYVMIMLMRSAKLSDN